MKHLLEKLSQESTWRGIIAMAAGFGCIIEPQLADGIVAVALALIGLINVTKKD